MKPLHLSRNLLRRLHLITSFSLCLASSFLSLEKLNYPLIGIDDANIYFVYARNLVNGFGFVYNAGGERVEGFTSLLWTLVCALVFKFSAHPEITLMIVNIVLVSLGVACAVDYLQHASFNRENGWGSQLFWSVLYLVLIYSSARYVVWNTITLMENALWSTLLLLTTLFVMREELSPGVINSRFIPLAILLLLTRPESNLWVAVFIGVLFLRIAAQSNFAIAIRMLRPSVIAAALTVIFLTLFRLRYFGYPFPNTYYAKVSPLLTYNIQQGMAYLSRYFASDPVITLCMVAIVIAVVRSLFTFPSEGLPREGFLFLPFITVVGLLSPLLVGGDHFGSFRVYQNIHPIEVLALLGFTGYILHSHPEAMARFKAYPRTTRSFAFALTLAGAAGIFQSQWTMWNFIDTEVGIEFRVADYGRKNGAFIQNAFLHLPQLPSLGTVVSGGLKYSYSGEVIDLLGLNNTAMAHNQGSRVGIKDHAAFDIDTFYQLEPDLLWTSTIIADNWHYDEIEIKESWENMFGLKGLFDENRFQSMYTYAKVSVRGDERYAIVGWFKKDFLNGIRINGDFQIEEYEYDSK